MMKSFNEFQRLPVQMLVGPTIWISFETGLQLCTYLGIAARWPGWVILSSFIQMEPVVVMPFKSASH